jgi:hypothetical protein
MEDKEGGGGARRKKSREELSNYNSETLGGDHGEDMKINSEVRWILSGPMAGFVFYMH